MLLLTLIHQEWRRERVQADLRDWEPASFRQLVGQWYQELLSTECQWRKEKIPQNYSSLPPEDVFYK